LVSSWAQILELDPVHVTDCAAADFFGGNSTKATSGINGALTRTQTELGIQDSVKQFYEDTLKSARDKARPDLIKVLTYKSAAAVEWLQDVFNLDLTLVSRLGYGFHGFRLQ
jgi:succinate dehydrogenase/fumarate reductase flavoprotein subunit